MALLSATAVYKKLDGVLAIAKDSRSISWSPSGSSTAVSALTMDVTKITNLQQTPADKPKVMLKIFLTEAGQADPVSHVFQFTSKSDPRADANAIRDALSTAMAKASQINAATQSTSAGQSAAMTIAAAVSGGKGGALWEDDEYLIADVRLQQTLLKENSELSKTFMEAKSMKPESLSLTQFTKQFWSSRIHLLRAQALSQAQQKGLYNVFSDISFPTSSDEPGKGGMNLTVEHIKAIFVQYPFLSIVYDEVMPKMNNNDHTFWSRYFQSQLHSTLRGLKVDRRTAPKDPLLDAYLDHAMMTGVRPTSSDLHIPKFIDLEGNEENHSQRKGNRPDMENRQVALERGPIIRRLNAISERLMVAVRPSDVDASAPIGIDEQEYEQLQLRDLVLREEQHGVALNIRDQSHFISENKLSGDDIDSARIRALDPSKAIQDVCADIDKHYSQPGNAPTINFDFEDEDEDMDDDEDQPKPHIIGANLASEHIHSLIEAHRSQYIEGNTTATNPKSYGGLSETVYERLVLTHATTIEFLHQFWSAFNSGDPSRANEIASLVESLNRAMDRINAVTEAAQAERGSSMRRLEAQAAEIYKKTGKRKKVDQKALGGGEDVVKQLLAPCIRSLGVAVETYRKIYEEQTREMQQAED